MMTYLHVMLLLAVAVPSAAGLVAGGGKKRSDCYVTLDVDGLAGATVKRARIIVCRDGDPCDQGACGDLRCDFDVALCVNQSDTTLDRCTPPPHLAALAARGALEATPPASSLVAGVCLEPETIVVPVRLNGKGRAKGPGVARIRVEAVAPAGTSPGGEVDRFTFKCFRRKEACGSTTTTVASTTTSSTRASSSTTATTSTAPSASSTSTAVSTTTSSSSSSTSSVPTTSASVASTTSTTVPCGTHALTFGSFGNGAGELSSPTGIALDHNARTTGRGLVYVADQGNDRISQFTTSGVWVSHIGLPGSGTGQLDAPMGLAFLGATGFVTDSANDRVQLFDEQGGIGGGWGSFGTEPGQFKRPRGVAVDETGQVYVADHENNRVQVFTSAGAFVRQLGGAQGAGDGQFFLPAGVATDLTTTLFVADRNNNRIQRFAIADGSFLGKWGAIGSAPGQLNQPEAVAVGGGRVFVADQNNHRVQQFTMAGAFTTTFGSNGSAAGQFAFPRGIAVDAAGTTIYVADTNNHRIQKLSCPP